MTTIHLWSLLYGAAGMAVLYTFFPKLAEAPSRWLRRGLAWAKDVFGRITVRKDAE